MNNQREKELILYRVSDWLMAAIAWFLFFVYRKGLEKSSLSLSEVLEDEKLLLGLLVIPLGWVIFYSIFDKYTDIYRYSRLATLRRTLILSLVGTLFLFFTIMVDDATLKHTNYFVPFVSLFVIHFGLTAISRLILLTWTKGRLKSGSVKYRTIFIGAGETAFGLYKMMKDGAEIAGHEVVGYVPSREDLSDQLASETPLLGSLHELDIIIKKHRVEEVIIATESKQQSELQSILEKLYIHRDSILVKVVPDMYDIMLGKVKMNHVYGVGLIEIDQELMPTSSRFLKRAFDLCMAIGLIIFCLPLYIFLAIKVKFSSEGPLLYKQERIGKDGAPFEIMKFRSMYIDAEAAGPQLSDDHDPRITPFGRIMRKWRLDEIPQFFNLFKGDMSLVGPRPERQHYIDLISEQAPLYQHLLKVRPGITSWGQVKYGYASSVEEMVQRMKYDLIYLENMSLSQDIKILFHTALVLLQGKGK